MQTSWLTDVTGLAGVTMLHRACRPIRTSTLAKRLHGLGRRSLGGRRGSSAYRAMIESHLKSESAPHVARLRDHIRHRNKTSDALGHAKVTVDFTNMRRLYAPLQARPACLRKLGSIVAVPCRWQIRTPDHLRGLFTPSWLLLFASSTLRASTSHTRADGPIGLHTLQPNLTILA
jgi:hypothetical protein